MNQGRPLTPDELKARAIRFYERYGKDMEQISDLLNIRLSQLAQAYTLENALPQEAITIATRVKSLGSFLKKLEKRGWPQFYYPTEVIQDLIGARVVCWFVDDCRGMQQFIAGSKHLTVHQEVEDYIGQPKASGYRSIHLLADVGYDRVQRNGLEVEIQDGSMVCEIQIRTMLQDAWGQITHEFHYKAQTAGVNNTFYERILAEIAGRLSNEDASLLTLRDAYQDLAKEQLKPPSHEGIKDGNTK
ncbi:GTP pyrophosphokinase [Ferrimonas sediminicola]|nr:RelA/SpoT domain-containing protein [Ferrimonas sediminicola]